MTIAGVSTVYNEADILAYTVPHMFAEGVDELYFAVKPSNDHTWGLLEDLATPEHRINLYQDNETHHKQPEWIDYLAGIAHNDGHEWIVPFDADEFFCATSGSRMTDAIDNLADSGIQKIIVPMYHYYDWDYRDERQKPLPKVVYRWSEQAHVEAGNHNVTLDGHIDGLLEVRELQYRSEDHFVQKIRDRLATLLDDRGGGHVLAFAKYSDDELREWWRSEQPFWGNQRTPIYDPILNHCHIGFDHLGQVQ